MHSKRRRLTAANAFFFALRMSDPSDDEEGCFFVFSIPCLSDAAFSCSFLAPIAADMRVTRKTGAARWFYRLAPPPGKSKPGRRRRSCGIAGF
jgi:hypothetical protein